MVAEVFLSRGSIIDAECDGEINIRDICHATFRLDGKTLLGKAGKISGLWLMKLLLVGIGKPYGS